LTAPPFFLSGTEMTVLVGGLRVPAPLFIRDSLMGVLDQPQGSADQRLFRQFARHGYVLDLVDNSAATIIGADRGGKQENGARRESSISRSRTQLKIGWSMAEKGHEDKFVRDS